MVDSNLSDLFWNYEIGIYPVKLKDSVSFSFINCRNSDVPVVTCGFSPNSFTSCQILGMFFSLRESFRLR